MKKFQRNLACVMAVLTLFSLMTACGAEETPSTEPTAPAAAPLSGCTVTVKTEGGMALEGVDVYVYADEAMQDMKGFAETKPAKELTKEERAQLNQFLKELGVAEPDKFMDSLAMQWLTLKQTLAANSAPAVSYLTEREEQELFLLLEKAGIAQDAWEAIKAGFSDYKLNFTETKAEKEISQEEMMNLLNFLMSCGADEKTAGRFLDKAVPMWAEYRLALAAKNEKAQLTKEDTAMVDSLVKSMGLREDAADVLYKKLFNYKRFFNETEPGKELTEEERSTLIALLEELGAKIDDKMIDKITVQWIDYKMKLVKTMMG